MECRVVTDSAVNHTYDAFVVDAATEALLFACRVVTDGAVTHRENATNFLTEVGEATAEACRKITSDSAAVHRETARVIVVVKSAAVFRSVASDGTVVHCEAAIRAIDAAAGATVGTTDCGYLCRVASDGAVVHGQRASVVNAAAAIKCCVVSDGAVVHGQRASVINAATVVCCVTSDDVIAQSQDAFIGDGTASSGVFVAICNSQPVDCSCYATLDVKNTRSTIILNC
ncbi:MAG: hypothetical protein V7L31_13350 [Nostoc sp.]|uniref:hypothetical protein n=1 Tax=Nostoc sp. TaxID=1180 RepID=UPI002FF02CF0